MFYSISLRQNSALCIPNRNLIFIMQIYPVYLHNDYFLLFLTIFECICLMLGTLLIKDN